MAATSDPNDPGGGKDKRHSPVIDLTASDVSGSEGAKKPEADKDAYNSETTADSASSAGSDGDRPDKSAKDDESKPNDAAADMGADEKGAEEKGKASDAPSTVWQDSDPGDVTSADDAAGSRSGGGSGRPRTSGVPTTGSATREAGDSDTGSGSADPGAAAASKETARRTPGDGISDEDDDDGDAFPPQEITIVRRGTGPLGLIFAALLGALLVLGGGYIALTRGLVPGTQELAAGLESRLSDLEQSVSAAGSGDGGEAIGSLRSELESVKSSIEGLGSGVPDRITALESRVGTLSEAANAVTPGEIETLRNSVQAATQQASDASSQAANANSAASQAATAANQAASQAEQANAAISALQQSVGSLQSTQASIQNSLQALNGTVSDLSSRVQKLEEQLGGPGPRETAALAVATALLENSVRNGQPFGPALAAVTSRLENPNLVAPLTPYAESGLPTEQALVEQFPDVERAIRDSVRGEAAESGFVSGLLANAESLVTIRRTSSDAGGSVGATLDTIRTDLRQGDLAGAEAAWQTLPDPAKAASKEWHDALAARVAAEELVDQVTGEVLSTLQPSDTSSGTAAPASPDAGTSPSSGN